MKFSATRSEQMENPEWTPEEQKLIDYFGTLDRVGVSIASYMQLTLPIATIRKLLPLADIACREKDPAGALVFFEIDRRFPRVTYYPKGNSVAVALARGSSSCYVLPLHAVLEFSMGPTRSKRTQ